MIFDCYYKNKSKQKNIHFRLPLICADFLENTRSRNADHYKKEEIGEVAKKIKDKVKNSVKKNKTKPSDQS